MSGWVRVIAACVLALGAGMVMGPRPLSAQSIGGPVPDARLLERFPLELAERIWRVIGPLQDTGLPYEPLIQRALQGESRGASPDRIVAAVTALAERMGAASRAMGPRVSSAALVAGADALAAGADTTVLRALTRSDREGSVATPLVVLADLLRRGIVADSAAWAVERLVAARLNDTQINAFRLQVEREIRTGASPTTSATAEARGMLLRARGRPPGRGPGPPGGAGVSAYMSPGVTWGGPAQWRVGLAGGLSVRGDIGSTSGGRNLLEGWAATAWGRTSIALSATNDRLGDQPFAPSLRGFEAVIGYAGNEWGLALEASGRRRLPIAHGSPTGARRFGEGPGQRDRTLRLDGWREVGPLTIGAAGFVSSFRRLEWSPSGPDSLAGGTEVSLSRELGPLLAGVRIGVGVPLSGAARSPLDLYGVGWVETPSWRGLALEATVGQAALDPLVPERGGRILSVGLTWDPARLARRPRPAKGRGDGGPPPIPDAPAWTVRKAEAAKSKVLVHGLRASDIRARGDFSDWQPVTMRSIGPDRWALPDELSYGIYRLLISVDGGSWEPPPGLPSVADEFGGRVGLLVLEPLPAPNPD